VTSRRSTSKRRVAHSQLKPSTTQCAWGYRDDGDVGLLYIGARWYNPAVGRWTSADRWLGNIYRPLSLNRYLYCEDDPVNAVDPSGNQPEPPYIWIPVPGLPTPVPVPTPSPTPKPPAPPKPKPKLEGTVTVKISPAGVEVGGETKYGNLSGKVTITPNTWSIEVKYGNG